MATAKQLDVVASEWKIPTEAKRALLGLAAAWDDVPDSRALEAVPLNGGMSNAVFRIRWPIAAGDEASASRNVLLRIYGEGVCIFFDREDEIRTFKLLSCLGHGPRLLSVFPSGRVEEFIHARTLSSSDLRRPEISALIASKLRELHQLEMPGFKVPLLWERLRNWLKAARRLSSSDEAKRFKLDLVEREISILEKELSSGDHKLGFCHNDLQSGNIMVDEESRVLTIIDYEYASFNPIAYDIANHFCEMAADYLTETPHVLDYSKYPDLEEQKRFVWTYLSSSGENPNDNEVEKLLGGIEKYTLASHLIWGLWALVENHLGDIDFDYLEYAKQRKIECMFENKALMA
ncbi:hypothetical protein HPP92_011191 [Vanilla planifolia]|uniref:Choline kinase n=1 Tax=Vanilla planifolia TaxID=51239 RepID=A0A835RAZ4_VANPL|nr:hypothetical protein HPP92_011477 [Vanilla planifolia]KAG0483107.1 hypothetical protein HPP92_011191 [Vanilla planifolia]